MKNQSDFFPPYFSKSVPIDIRYQLVMGGTKNKGLFDPTDTDRDLHDSQLFIVARTSQNASIIEARLKLNHYWKHAACVVLDKRYLYMLGGEINGQWTKQCTKINVIGLAKDRS